MIKDTPKTLVIIALGFIVEGVLGAYSLLYGIPQGRIFLNSHVAGFFIAAFLLEYRPLWRKIALLVLGVHLFSLPFYIYPLLNHIFTSLDANLKSYLTTIVLILLGVFWFWAFMVLTSDKIISLFSAKMHNKPDEADSHPAGSNRSP